MTWNTQLGRLSDTDAADGRRCEQPDCKVVLAPYLARTEWTGAPPAQEPRTRRLCCNHAAAFAATYKLPFPPGFWKDGAVGRAPKVFDIPKDTPMSQCRSCGDLVRWIVTENGKRMPCNLDGSSHFTTCVNADQHRRRA